MTDCIFRIATCKTQGKRKMQEDACGYRVLGDSFQPEGETGAEASSDRFISVLADGMGGHAGGARASETATSVFLEEYVSSSGPIRTRLKRALERCNSSLKDIVGRHPELAGMGCTLVGVSLEDDMLRWVSVGDSILYLIRRDRGIRRLNEDHSMMPVLNQMVQRGEMSAADAEQHPHRNALRSALTGEPVPMVDLPEEGYEIDPEDWIIVGSDGLLTLTEGRIAETADRFSKMGPTAVARALIGAIDGEHRPNQDNATVIVIHAESYCAPTEKIVSSEDTEPVRHQRQRQPYTQGIAAIVAAIVRQRFWLPYTLGIAGAVAAGLLYGFMLAEGATKDNPPKRDAAEQNSKNEKSNGWITTISSGRGKQDSAGRVAAGP